MSSKKDGAFKRLLNKVFGAKPPEFKTGRARAARDLALHRAAQTERLKDAPADRPISHQVARAMVRQQAKAIRVSQRALAITARVAAWKSAKAANDHGIKGPTSRRGAALRDIADRNLVDVSREAAQ